MTNGVTKLQGLRGMPDLLPHETALWQRIESTARRHFKNAAIPEIRTPILEVTELFARGIGEGTDVVGKEMYSFFDRGNRDCTMRPEGTASVVRAAIQHGLISKGIQRLWYAGPMFRYERPQAGRQRQFHQIGFECLGQQDPRSDIEAITIAWDILQELKIKNLTLEINTLGDRNDRLLFREKLVNWLTERKDQLDKDSIDRLSKNPLRILDSKNSSTQELLKKAPKMEDDLSPESIERFKKVQSGLNKLNIPFKTNSLLVRGLDYYTHTAFEITSTELGAQATVCGGGRYDGLVQQLGGSATPAIGWALGMERLVLLLSQEEEELNNKISPEIFIINRGLKAESLALNLSRELRQQNRIVEVDLTGAAITKQIKRADKSGARWAIFIGENEVEKGAFVLKDLRSSSTQKEKLLSWNNLLQRFSE